MSKTFAVRLNPEAETLFTTLSIETNRDPSALLRDAVALLLEKHYPGNKASAEMSKRQYERAQKAVLLSTPEGFHNPEAFVDSLFD